MGLNELSSGERLHIGFFGMRNAGKSSLVNAVTGQKLSVVSAVKGTTTDPVKKAMELLPLGPVVIIDTPGMDDEGELGEMRVERAKQILSGVDIAVLVVDASCGLSAQDRALIALLQTKQTPYIVAMNKADLLHERPELGERTLYVSAASGEGVQALKEALGAFAQKEKQTKTLLSDLLAPQDVVVLVTPIDEAAPKGRLILPQQMAIRDILDAHGIPVLCRPGELRDTLALLNAKPKLVVTDSQAFARVSADTPKEIPLTSFSILMARYKGDLPALTRGAAALERLRDGDCVLISEGCTHHRQCKDIGSVKIPGWLESYTGAKLRFTLTSGGEFPDDPSPYALVVHCGGCMLGEAEMKRRMQCCEQADVPMVNYGVAIAQMHGILLRSLELFPDAAAQWRDAVRSEVKTGMGKTARE